MKVLVINAGSSSLKYQVIEMDTETMLCKGLVERIGENNAKLVNEVVDGPKFELVAPMKDHTAALRNVLKALVDPKNGCLKDVSEIKVVGHRVLHAAEDFKDSILMTKENLEICHRNEYLGPLHQPANLACVEACMEVMPNTPMVGVFDTAFHSTMPKYAYMYGVPYEMYKKYKIRRYGFHGTSHKFVSNAVREILGEKQTARMITCHLGNGSSISAVKDGQCIDTSMGMTPLEGLIMGTRSGDLDPAVVEFLCKFTGKNVSEVVLMLNKESGFKGIAGVSDCRDLKTMADNGDKNAQLALDMFAYRVKKYIGAYAAALGGVDCIVFTGGIGENAAHIREAIMKDMEYLGIDFNFTKNNHAERHQFVELTKPKSKVKVVIMPTNEELVIARDAVRISGVK